MRKVLAELNHIHPIVAACQEKSAVRNNHHWARHVFIPDGTVNVQEQVLRHEVGIDVLAVRNVIFHVDLIKGPCAPVPVTVTIVLGVRQQG